MNDEQRLDIIRRLQQGEDLSPEWARILFPPEKHECELVYHGKEREEDVIANTIAVPLQRVRMFGQDGNTWHNMLIFGDNLQVMKTLLEMRKIGQLCNSDGTAGVRLVYIDPPFASKQDFRGRQDETAYQDKVGGAKFLEFIRRRLILLRELLAEDGSIFVHMDQRKMHYIKALLDEVFGEHNFRNEIELPSRASKNLQQQFEAIKSLNVRHDTLLWYSKHSKTRFTPLWIEKHRQGNPEGHWHSFWSTADRKTMRYQLLGVTPETGQWTWEERRARIALANHKRYLKEGGGRTLAEYWRDTGSALDFVRPNPDNGTPQYWRPPAERRLADTVWAGVPIYNNTTGYPTEKHEALLAEILNLASKPGDLVLDAFAGSGTTSTVADKLTRRWVAIDCGKLSIYTVQKRMLTLRKEIGNSGTPLTPRPFDLFNAGLYDFSKLKDLPWAAWRFFALQLFQCRDAPHKIGGIQFDGYLKGSSVMVFNYQTQPGVRIDERTIQSMHAALGSKVGNRLFVVAPALVFDFQQDYLTLDSVRFYALRIPYSIIHELHQRDFTALRQPIDELAVNDTVDAVGFDFVRRPELAYEAGAIKRKGQLIEEGFLKIKVFRSEAAVREPALRRGNRETLSMVMLDYSFDSESAVFALDAVFYADAIAQANWVIHFPVDKIGSQIMAVFVDIYGNEAREVIPDRIFRGPETHGARSRSNTTNVTRTKQ